jgi:nucleoside-diphosphate-sugar epimerase
MKLLVTGATGFIGQYLVKKLTQEGHSVRCLVRDLRQAEKLLGKKNIEYVQGDLTITETLDNICDQISVVYHLAAVMGHEPPSKSAFEKFRQINTEGTKNLAECCVGKGIDRFIYVSSTAAMGLLNESVVSEVTPCRPHTPYQVSKYEGELVLKEFLEKHSLPVVILRPSMVYGPGFGGDFLTISKLVKTGFFPKIGFGKNLSPALYIEDLKDCLYGAKEKAAVGETYIISSEESYELERVARIIAEALGVKVRMFFVPKFLAKSGAGALEHIFTLLGKKPIVTTRNIESTTTDRIFKVTKAKRDLGFQQKVTIEQGLRNTVRYFQSVGYL